MLLPSDWGRAEEVLPVYQRTRTIAWHDAGLTGPAFPTQQAWLWPGNGAGPWFPGFAPSFQAGTWYQRPYPYHFDYYKWRYATPPVGQMPYPCEEATPLGETQVQALPGPE
jgi:hypothetical protein